MIAVFGVIIGGIGQGGDLLESLMERDAEVKDAGKLIPGFGGVLDVVTEPATDHAAIVLYGIGFSTKRGGRLHNKL